MRRLITFLVLLFPALPVHAQHPLDAAAGKALFERQWIPAPASTAASDGLGPYYNARSCAACHPGGGRGVNEQALTVSIDDPVYGVQFQPMALAGLEPEVELQIDWEPVTLAVEGKTYELRRPALSLGAARYGEPSKGHSLRLAPGLRGLAQLAQIEPETLRALADPDDRNGDGISGRPAMLSTPGEPGPRIGRFGWKASTPDLHTQVALAFSLDLGMGSRHYPASHGDCTPHQEDCLRQIPGTATPTNPTNGTVTPATNGTVTPADAVELSDEIIMLVLTYVESLYFQDMDENKEGQALFEASGCSACHLPLIQSGGEALRPYTDLLLHDMGEGLADSLELEHAGRTEWRTAPLRGIGEAGRLLHDGRARTLFEAILWHGGEASAARAAFLELPKEQRDHLIGFLLAL